jgi:hypothetical protein
MPEVCESCGIDCCDHIVYRQEQRLAETTKNLAKVVETLTTERDFLKKSLEELLDALEASYEQVGQPERLRAAWRASRIALEKST